MAFHFAFPPTGLGIADEELFGLESGAEARSVLAGGEKFGTVECEVTFAWAFCWQSEAMAQFQLGFEKIGLQPVNSRFLQLAAKERFCCGAGGPVTIGEGALVLTPYLRVGD